MERIKTTGQELGGSEDFSVYQVRDTVPYCDKGSHRESSLYHAPQHRDHWKKEEKKKEVEVRRQN